MSQARLSLTAGAHARYELKTRYSDATTHVLFEALDFIARLAALVPKPRVNLTRFHGVFAPNSANRAQVTKAHRGKGATVLAAAQTDERTPAERRASMTWAQRLERVFGIDIETCSVCGQAMRILACIEDPLVIEKILAHLDAKHAAAQTLPAVRPLHPGSPLLLRSTRGLGRGSAARTARHGPHRGELERGFRGRRGGGRVLGDRGLPRGPAPPLGFALD